MTTCAELQANFGIMILYKSSSSDPFYQKCPNGFNMLNLRDVPAKQEPVELEYARLTAHCDRNNRFIQTTGSVVAENSCRQD